MYNLSYSCVIVEEKEKRNGILWANCLALKGGRKQEFLELRQKTWFQPMSCEVVL